MNALRNRCLLVAWYMHILPKRFQRIRYYGLQATTSLRKWVETIANAAGYLVDGMMNFVSHLKYCDFFR